MPAWRSAFDTFSKLIGCKAGHKIAGFLTFKKNDDSRSLKFDRSVFLGLSMSLYPQKLHVLVAPLYTELPAFVCSTWLPYLGQTAVCLALIGQFATWQEMPLMIKSLAPTSSASHICRKQRRRPFSVTTQWNFMDFTEEWIIPSSC